MWFLWKILLNIRKSEYSCQDSPWRTKKLQVWFMWKSLLWIQDSEETHEDTLENYERIFDLTHRLLTWISHWLKSSSFVIFLFPSRFLDETTNLFCSTAVTSGCLNIVGAFITFVLIRHANKRAELANKKQINTPSKSMHPGRVMAAYRTINFR